MNREKPTDPIIYEGEENGGTSVKKSFQQKFIAQLDGSSDAEGVQDPLDEANVEEDEKPSYFRPNFNVPQTMRGIKNLSLGLGIKGDGKSKP